MNYFETWSKKEGLEELAVTVDKELGEIEKDFSRYDSDCMKRKIKSAWSPILSRLSPYDRRADVKLSAVSIGEVASPWTEEEAIAGLTPQERGQYEAWNNAKGPIVLDDLEIDMSSFFKTANMPKEIFDSLGPNFFYLVTQAYAGPFSKNKDMKVTNLESAITKTVELYRQMQQQYMQ
jgi:hypothetical protein